MYYETSKPISVIAMCKYFLNYVIKEDLACKVLRSNLLIEQSDLIVCYFRLFREVPASLAERGASHGPVTGRAEVSPRNVEDPVKY